MMHGGVTQLDILLQQFFPEPHASLVSGMVWGVDLKDHPHFYEELKRAGIVHIVVLSGTNITLLANMVFSLTSARGRRIAFIITTLSIAVFITFVGIEPPIARAGCMAFLSILGSSMGRKTISLYLLLLSALFLLICYPEWISSVSFQLSYAATTGILLFANPATEISPQRTTIAKIRNYLSSELRLSLVAQLATMPVLLYHFRELSVVAPLTNTLISWMIVPVMLLGMATTISALVWEPFAQLLAFACTPLLSLLVWVTGFTAQLPFAVFSLP
jgi:competence protein ComEC